MQEKYVQNHKYFFYITDMEEEREREREREGAKEEGVTDKR